MKIGRQSTNIEDRRDDTDYQKLMRGKQTEKGFYNDVLKEPTPISRQKNNEKRTFKPERNLNIKDNVDYLSINGARDPKPGFLKHTTKDNLK